MDIMTDQLRKEPVRKGRGAVGNPAGRFEQTERLAVDDGWGSSEADSD